MGVDREVRTESNRQAVHSARAAVRGDIALTMDAVLRLLAGTLDALEAAEHRAEQAERALARAVEYLTEMAKPVQLVEETGGAFAMNAFRFRQKQARAFLASLDDEKAGK